MTVITTDLVTPVGPVRVAVRDHRVVALAFVDHFARVERTVRSRDLGESWCPGRTDAADAVAAYVGGDLGALDDVPVAVTGTPFQEQVWTALRRIPPGETRSYAELATSVGSPRAVRAVGRANGANPVWLIVPCHRVIRGDGNLGGYGGGVGRKAWLLGHEGSRVSAGRVVAPVTE